MPERAARMVVVSRDEQRIANPVDHRVEAPGVPVPVFEVQRGHVAVQGTLPVAVQKIGAPGAIGCAGQAGTVAEP